jgi:manganese transport protein
LLYVVFVPLVTKQTAKTTKFHTAPTQLEINPSNQLNTIAVAVDFSDADNKAINKAIQLGGNKTKVILVHVLESAGAFVYGEQTNDLEREEDLELLKNYQSQLISKQISCEYLLGFGNPKTAIPEMVLKAECDMLVMGTHGHKTIKDILLGTTVEGVRHNLKGIPLVLV